MRGPSDWEHINHNNSLPHTCCANMASDGNCTMKSSEKFTTPCLDELKKAFIRYGSLIGGVGIGIALVQVKH